MLIITLNEKDNRLDLFFEGKRIVCLKLVKSSHAQVKLRVEAKDSIEIQRKTISEERYGENSPLVDLKDLINET